MRPELSDYSHISGGKVREIYEVDEQTLLMVATDRISAFDFSLEPAIPDKGRILTATSMSVSYTHLTLPTIYSV